MYFQGHTLSGAGFCDEIVFLVFGWNYIWNQLTFSNFHTNHLSVTMPIQCNKFCIKSVLLKFINYISCQFANLSKFLEKSEILCSQHKGISVLVVTNKNCNEFISNMNQWVCVYVSHIKIGSGLGIACPIQKLFAGTRRKYTF